MAKIKSFRTAISSRGKVFLPKSIRAARGWSVGTELDLVDVHGGVLIRTTPLFARTELRDVIGSLTYPGPSKSLQEIDRCLRAEAKRVARS